MWRAALDKTTSQSRNPRGSSQLLLDNIRATHARDLADGNFRCHVGPFVCVCVAVTFLAIRCFCSCLEMDPLDVIDATMFGQMFTQVCHLFCVLSRSPRFICVLFSFVVFLRRLCASLISRGTFATRMNRALMLVCFLVLFALCRCVVIQAFVVQVVCSVIR